MQGRHAVIFNVEKRSVTKKTEKNNQIAKFRVNFPFTNFQPCTVVTTFQLIHLFVTKCCSLLKLIAIIWDTEDLFPRKDNYKRFKFDLQFPTGKIQQNETN